MTSSLSSSVSTVWIFVAFFLSGIASIDNEFNNEIDSDKGLSKSVNSNEGTLAATPGCQADVLRVCGKKAETLPNLDVLECILNRRRNQIDDISDACNDVLWHYRKNITEPAGFLKLADENCMADFKKTGCWLPQPLPGGPNNLVPCLIDNKDKVETLRCQTLITRLEGVIFGDYEMIENFANSCEEDIKALKCGRNELDQMSSLKKLPHSQGKTIECLSGNVDKLKKECALQIFRVAELQSDDFHLDRALYFACKDDRERFCAQTEAGNGRVYKCLLRHKLDQEMSGSCREQIYRRQKLGWQDYKASGIVSSCRDEIKKYKCRKGVNSSDKHVRLSQILLCLENEHHKGNGIDGECMDEIKQHRKSLLEDYRVTPELLSACTSDKDKFCPEKGLHGRTLHCLMKHAQMRGQDERLSDVCKVELENLIRVSDVASDWQVDPMLRQNCQHVVDSSSCSKYPSNKVLGCLMNLLGADSGTDTMTDECEETLMQIQYFLARNFPMDSALSEICAEDAHRICGATTDWSDLDKKGMEPERGPLILSCLFRNIAGDDPAKIVSPKCTVQVRETMRQRALSVHLLPEVEDACMQDLTDLCSDKTKPGEELQCLQVHLEELEKKCKQVVTNFTELEMKNPTVDPWVWRHCHEYIEGKCSSRDKSKSSSEDDDIVDCLINLKTDMKNKKCKISIEHLQLLKLKDIRFSPKFKSQCQIDVGRYCNEKEMQPLTSWKVVNCLSKMIRNDIITENTLRVSKGCRKQVRNLLLSKLQLEHGSSDTKSIYKLCRTFVDTLCQNVDPGQGRILECLRDNSNKIPTDSECHEALFRVEQETDADSRLDLALNTDCRMEIQLFCNKDPENVLDCLKLSSTQDGFGPKCAAIVKERVIEQGTDSQLNHRLFVACKLDLKKFCSQVEPGQGRKLSCLKAVFVNPKIRLTDSCKAYVEDVLQHAAKEDIKYDADLYVSCQKFIEQSCFRTSTNEEESGKTNTEECLKQLYKDRKITDSKCKDKIAQLIQSIMIDIHVDPILNQGCAIDLLRHCASVPPGEGRLLKCLYTKMHEEQQLPKERTSLLSERCRSLLSKRGELFHLAGENVPGPVESLVDLVEQVQISPQRNYLLTAGMSIVGLIFIFGLFCGRATRRKASEKNK